MSCTLTLLLNQQGGLHKVATEPCSRETTTDAEATYFMQW